MILQSIYIFRGVILLLWCCLHHHVYVELYLEVCNEYLLISCHHNKLIAMCGAILVCWGVLKWPGFESSH